MNSISKLLVSLLFPVTAFAGPGSSGGGAPAPVVEDLCPTPMAVPANGYRQALPDGTINGREVKVTKNSDGTYRVSGSLSSSSVGMPFFFDFKARMSERGALEGRTAINEGNCSLLVRVSARACVRKASHPYVVDVSVSNWVKAYMDSPNTYDYSCARAIKDPDFGGYQPSSSFGEVHPDSYSTEEREAWLAR